MLMFQLMTGLPSLASTTSLFSILGTGGVLINSQKRRRSFFTKEVYRSIVPSLGILDGLKVVLENMISHIQDKFPNTVKFWRLQSPRHFYGGEWNQNGSCMFDKPLHQSELDSLFEPSNNGVNKEARMFNRLIQEALQGTDIQILDLTHLSEFRADAHPAIWLGKKDAVAIWGQDCMHWCLPGVPDTWIDTLSALIQYSLENET